MTVRCKVEQCPYYDGKGLCAKEVIGIDEMGMCTVLWRKGQQKKMRTPISEEWYPRRPVTIIDVTENEIKKI